MPTFESLLGWRAVQKTALSAVQRPMISFWTTRKQSLNALTACLVSCSAGIAYCESTTTYLCIASAYVWYIPPIADAGLTVTISGGTATFTSKLV